MTTLVESAPPGSLDMRVEDFLDDRLQSAADIDSLDELLTSIDLQRGQLQSQLDDAIRALEDARRTAVDHQLSLSERIHGFNELQKSIDVRVEVAAASDAPSEAIARLQVPMKKLQMVDLARRYLRLFSQPLTQLRELVVRLEALPGAGELHLVAYLQDVVQGLRTKMHEIMTTELERALAARNWPRVDPQSQLDDEIVACFDKLLDLQLPEIVHSSSLVSLSPFNVMADSIEAEFRFHFLRDKPTSSPQAIGSHCFPWFLATIDKWSDFFRDNLGHLLAAKFRDSPVADKTAYLDPVCAFITSMLPVMQEKVDDVVWATIEDTSYLSGFVPQLLAFDDEIRTRFNYDGGDADSGWPGLAARVLSRYFEDWFSVERALALERFEVMMQSPDAGKIDYNYALAGKMKPTFAAVGVLDLLRAVTTKYERLRKLKHKTRFLADIQLDILDAYHDRLRGSLEAYQSITTTLGRTLHGATREQLAALEGTGALETLCKVIGSADRIASTLSEWSDDEFFASLWEELQARDAERSSPDADEAFRGRVPDMSAADGDESGIFDETVSAYTMRRKAAEELLIGALADSHSKAFRAYLHQAQWTTVGEAAILDDPSHLSITPELDEPLRILKRNLDFVSRALSTASFRRVWHRALDWLQDMLWNGVLMRQSFTTLGAAQFAYDGGAIFALVDRYMTAGPSALEALSEGMRLLNLPVSSADGSVMTLKEASDRAFTSNDEARRLLEALGFDALTPMNARQILERRVENEDNVGW
ncbi:hypothetical protein XA68_15628 [Ophiocordyceps unilateralis]|uniref:RINT-1 family protein n=1 Tax=Ophiocordyceps unilateralis TaxID=268505 RepID=A0A2A9PMC0_OPHUN|nr:hypothetical protein XA68_15628 [Ophiocordyceps unilateralis]